jgi:hypothetical protein
MFLLKSCKQNYIIQNKEKYLSSIDTQDAGLDWTDSVILCSI